jgi:hypothetical protein
MPAQISLQLLKAHCRLPPPSAAHAAKPAHALPAAIHRPRIQRHSPPPRLLLLLDVAVAAPRARLRSSANPLPPPHRSPGQEIQPTPVSSLAECNRFPRMARASQVALTRRPASRSCWAPGCCSSISGAPAGLAGLDHRPHPLLLPRYVRGGSDSFSGSACLVFFPFCQYQSIPPIQIRGGGRASVTEPVSVSGAVLASVAQGRYAASRSPSPTAAATRCGRACCCNTPDVYIPLDSECGYKHIISG